MRELSCTFSKIRCGTGSSKPSEIKNKVIVSNAVRATAILKNKYQLKQDILN